MTAALELGSKHQLTIEGITSEGAGVGRLDDGRVVFAHRTAPGDRTLVEITSIRPKWARGRAVEVLDSGPDRRQAPCPHYDWCGGCTLEHVSYEAQLRLKGKLVLDALSRIGKRSRFPEPSLHASPKEMRYRNRIALTLVRGPEGQVTAGFHRLEDSGAIGNVDGRCLLPEAPISAVWDRLRQQWGDGAIRLPGGPALRLTFRSIGAENVLLLVEGGVGKGDPDALITEVPGLRSIWHRREGSAARPKLLAGAPGLSEFWYGEEVEVGPTAFLQANRDGAKGLHRYVIDEAGPVEGSRTIDAYCGFGAFGRWLARSGAQAVGIEADPEAVGMAVNRIVPGFRMLVGRVEDLLPEALPADLVILNPPRVGVHAKVIGALKKEPPARIIYVSCDPATLARDVRRLGDSYEISRIGVFDLFPQTAHVETVLTLDAY